MPTPPIKLQVALWRSRFENNRTLDMKNTNWVPVPNRMDNVGYLTLVAHPNGAAHLGAWLAIIEIASRQKVRGTIPQEGAGIPQALALISRLPAGLFEEVIPRLLELQWIEQVTEIPQEGAGIPQEGAPRDARASASEKGREGKGTEQKGREGKAAPAPDDFDGHDLVSETSDALCRQHSAAGFQVREPRIVRSQVELALGSAVDPRKIALVLLAAHATLVPLWKAEKIQNDRFRVKELHWWIKDGGYLHPPQAAKPDVSIPSKPFSRKDLPQ